ncbi:hypothetical protein OIU85_026786 [Salix viminalis]|uniref:Pentacotripeptide-repeat region of PRORP domain-containing protein n=1 Tax=Salix viminalis TaxID=40686 RepID=A0A9Q0YYZ0_SALVM|nr:hypothetical protein OIU85_026786 [Salix viminalis]KAJ6715317.1 hypothetical protein OIU85_026786 [Salix viminalis]KAJ6715318.1 hypothetical protein OIU85_026786 [Salix viminalis]KAJ6715319.1 hypothetical protein OIU85_026786 [Salix viminalis]KAJ6715320.1 hypothetical protein OIU85_026786 [Salix viminalis]
MTAQTIFRTLLDRPNIISSKYQAKQLHAQILKLEPASPTHLSRLISIYSNFNLLHDSLLLFNTLHSPPVLAYKSIIRCYVANGLLVQSVALFLQMRASGKQPDHHVFPSLLKSCALLSDLKLGESIHGCIIRLGMDFDLYTCNALMNMYGKLQKVIEPALDQNGSLNQARYILPKTNANNTILNQCYRKRNCSYMAEVDRRGSMMDSVKKVFEMMLERDVVSWNTVIAGNAENGKYEEALMLVREMGNDNLKPDSFTLSSVLPIFTEYVDLHKGKEIHAYVIRHGFDNDVFIGSSLVGMYAKCARVEDALQVFNILPQRDSISWNSIIAGCVQNGLFDEGLRFFHQMLKAKVKPVPVSFSSIMPACANLMALHLGKQLHGFIIRGGYDDNIFVSSSLVDMYAKCGYIKVARWIFDRMDVHDMVSWTAIIMGYALHGQACHAISLFEQMEMQGVRPNYVAFVAVLTACSHAGMMNAAWRYFNSMTQNYGIVPGLEHYACMADLLGRAGKLDEAFELISSMHKPAGSIWLSLLSACRVHKNVDLAEKVANKIFEVDPENNGAYILLSNIYAAAQRWKDVAKLQYLMRNKGIKKTPAFSWIEVKNKTPVFVSGDKSHP